MNFEKLLYKADDAFWAVIAEAFPEATTGDFPPDATLNWHEAIEKAIRIWLFYNMPFEPGYRFKLTRDVERFPHFVAKEGSTGTVTVNDDNGVCAKMDQPFDGAREWDNEIQWESLFDFIDDIDPLRESGGPHDNSQ